MGRTESEASFSAARSFVACTVSLTLSFAEAWLLNFAAFPLFDPVYLWTREASAIIGGIALVVVAIASYWHPNIFSYKRMTVWTLGFMGAGITALCLGFATSLPLILVGGAAAITVGSKLSNILVGFSCVGLGLRKLSCSVSLAYLAAYGMRSIFTLMPSLLNLAAFCLVPLIALMPVLPLARAEFDRLHNAESPAQMALGSPSSVLPFGHQLFVTLLVFRFIYGFTLSFGEIDRTPAVALIALVPLSFIFVYVVLSRDRFTPDVLFQASLLCSVAGFLLLPVGGETAPAVSALLSFSTGCFEIFMYFMLIALGSKNVVNALPLLAWGNAMASLGTLLGANVGRMANLVAADSTLMVFISGSIVFVMVAYIVIVQRAFDFAGLIQRLTPPHDFTVVAHAFDESRLLEERCRALGRARGLTAREQEVFEYLARGRNIRFVQEKLTVSYNTVRTHVSHIYAKLDVHSHQELIDLVIGDVPQ